MKRIADVSTDRGGINYEARGFIGKCSNEKEIPTTSGGEAKKRSVSVDACAEPDLLLPVHRGPPLGGLSEGEQLNGRRHQSRES